MEESKNKKLDGQSDPQDSLVWNDEALSSASTRDIYQYMVALQISRQLTFPRARQTYM